VQRLPQRSGTTDPVGRSPLPSPARWSHERALWFIRKLEKERAAQSGGNTQRFYAVRRFAPHPDPLSPSERGLGCGGLFALTNTITPHPALRTDSSVR